MLGKPQGEVMKKESERILEAMKSAVSDELEKKRRLEHYTVVWKKNRIVIIENNDKRISCRISTGQ